MRLHLCYNAHNAYTTTNENPETVLIFCGHIQPLHYLTPTNYFSLGCIVSSMLVATKLLVTTNIEVISLLLSQQSTSFVVTKVCLSWQNFCHNKHVFVVTNICHDKTFVTTKIFCRNKHNFVTVKVLSQQAYFCHDQRHDLSWQNFCHNKKNTFGSSHHW